MLEVARPRVRPRSLVRRPGSAVYPLVSLEMETRPQGEEDAARGTPPPPALCRPRFRPVSRSAVALCSAAVTRGARGLRALTFQQRHRGRGLPRTVPGLWREKGRVEMRQGTWPLVTNPPGYTGPAS